MKRVYIPTIAAFSRGRRVWMFQGALARRGEPMNLVDGRLWLEGHAPSIEGSLVLFVSGHKMTPDDRARIVRTAGSTPFCMVLDAEKPPPELQGSDDTPPLFLWPGNQAEILSWLETSRPMSDSTVPVSVTLPILEEFAELKLAGCSPAFLEVLQQTKKIAVTTAPVLIKGETGTGKELIARAIHYLGPRQNRAFVPVNCGAIPENLLESELFGYEKGAFTDARESHSGLVAYADGGTLFLDEIDSLSPKGQVILLRFLQDQQYRPLGTSKLRQGNIRVIAASNTNLKALVDKREFRPDLMFRLNILHIHLPPLAARTGDIEVLANHFIERISALYGKPRKILAPQALKAMNEYSWPGNVRELENFIHRAYLLSEGDVIETTSIAFDEHGQEFQPPVEAPASPLLPLRQAKAESIARFERNYLSHLLKLADGNVTRAARLAATERRALGKLLKRYGLSSHSIPGGTDPAL